MDPIITIFRGCFGGTPGNGFVAKWTRLPADAPLSARVGLGKGSTKDAALSDLVSQSTRAEIFSMPCYQVEDSYTVFGC
jgi:hypothetical protein